MRVLSAFTGCLVAVLSVVLAETEEMIPVGSKFYRGKLPSRLTSISNNDVYPTYQPPTPATPQFSLSLARNMSQTTDLREYIMKYVEDERICSSPTLRQLILGADENDMQAQVWWSRRCGGRRGNPLHTIPALSEMNARNQEKIRRLMRDKRIHCKPKKMVVRLPNDEPDRVTLEPSCVYIKQCSGCCSHDLLECTSIKTKTRKFPVMAFQPSGRKRRFADNNIIRYVRVQEHKACQCQCKVRAEHCSPQQVYNEEACQCTCPRHTYMSCPRDKVWSKRECRCVCSRPSDCTSGWVFDTDTCRCADPQLKDAYNL